MNSIIKGVHQIVSGLVSVVGVIVKMLVSVVAKMVNALFKWVGMAAGFNVGCKFFKTRIVVFSLVVSYGMAPYFFMYALKYPVRAAEQAAKGTLGMYNLYMDGMQIVERVVPKSVHDINGRYQITSHIDTIREVTGSKSVPWYHRLVSPYTLIKNAIKL